MDNIYRRLGNEIQHPAADLASQNYYFNGGASAGVIGNRRRSRPQQQLASLLAITGSQHQMTSPSGHQQLNLPQIPLSTPNQPNRNSDADSRLRKKFKTDSPEATQSSEMLSQLRAGTANSRSQLNLSCAIRLSERAIEDLNVLIQFASATGCNQQNIPSLNVARELILQFSMGIVKTSSLSDTLLPTPTGLGNLTPSIMGAIAEVPSRQLLPDFANCTIADFTLLSTVGTGTFGQVKLAKYKQKDQYFCIKILSKEKMTRLRQQEHVRNEKEVLSSVDNPFIVKLYATLQDAENVYFVTEYVSGGELFTSIRKSKGLDLATVKFYAGIIAREPMWRIFA